MFCCHQQNLNLRPCSSRAYYSLLNVLPPSVLTIGTICPLILAFLLIGSPCWPPGIGLPCAMFFKALLKNSFFLLTLSRLPSVVPVGSSNLLKYISSSPSLKAAPDLNLPSLSPACSMAFASFSATGSQETLIFVDFHLFL